MRQKTMGDLQDVTKAMHRVIVDMRGGERLCKTIRLKDGGAGDTILEFHLEPSGRRVGPATAKRILTTRYVVPMGDGLLGPDSSQTWAAK